MKGIEKMNYCDKILEIYIDAAEDEGWAVQLSKEDIYFSRRSDAGEDFGFYADYNLPQSVYDYFEDYDAEAHAAMWYNAKSDGVLSLRDLLDDAESIGDMLNTLCWRFSEIESLDLTAEKPSFKDVLCEVYGTDFYKELRED